MDYLSMTQTPLLVLSNLAIILFIYILLKPSMTEPFGVISFRRNLSVLLMFLFFLFSFWGADWFHYAIEYQIAKDGIYISNLETVYQFFASVSSNYLIFRLLIWGPALILILRLFSKVSVSTDLALFFFGSIWIIWFGYARVSLALAMMFYGVVCLRKPDGRFSLFSFVIGLAFIFSSFYFHKTAFFGIVVILLALCLDLLNKKILKALIFISPLFLFVFSYYISMFMEADIDVEDAGELAMYAAKGQDYMSRDSGQGGVGGLIMRILEKIPYYILAILSYKFYNSDLYEEAPREIKMFAKILFLLVLISSAFAFNIGANTSLLYVRFIRFCFIPATIMISYFHQNNYYVKWTNRAFFIALFSTLYAVLYVAYTRFMNS